MIPLQKIPETYVLPVKPVPFGTLKIIAYVEPAHIIYIDSFPTLLAEPLNLFCSKVDFSYLRHQYIYAWLRWDCILIDLWHNENIYKLIRKHLYAHFSNWRLYIYLDIRETFL